MLNDTDLQDLNMYVIKGWPSGRADIKQDTQPCKTFRDKQVMIEGVAMKCRLIIIPTQLQSKACTTTTWA